MNKTRKEIQAKRETVQDAIDAIWIENAGTYPMRWPAEAQSKLEQLKQDLIELNKQFGAAK